MPIKIFTTISGPCPFGKNVTIDSPGCRSCEHFYRTGTGMFFWCNNLGPKSEESVLKSEESVLKSGESVSKTTKSVPETRKRVPKTTKLGTEPKKRGRPAGKAEKKPVKTRKKKNG